MMDDNIFVKSLKNHSKAWGVMAAVVSLGILSQLNIGAGGVLFWILVGSVWGGIIVTVTAIQTKQDRQTHASNFAAQKPRTYHIPQDAHDAVEAFARLACTVYNWIQRTCPGRDKHLYWVVIRLTFGTDDSNAHAKFKFDFDYGMGSIQHILGMELGEGFTIKGDDVEYEADNIENLYSWVGCDVERLKAQGAALKTAADPIVTTVVNNCPDAYVEAKVADADGFYVTFRFR